MKIEAPLWRAIAIFRVVALGYAAVLIAHNHPTYRYPLGGWAVLAVMAVWTVVAIQIFRDPARRRWPYLAADLVVSVLCLLSTALVETHANLVDGHANLSSSWVAAPVLAWAVQGGLRWGITAAVLISVADFGLRGLYADHVSQSTFNGTVLLLMGGVVVGHMAKLARVSETRLAHWCTIFSSVAVRLLMHPRCRRVTALLARRVDVQHEFCGIRWLPGVCRPSTGLSAVERRTVSGLADTPRHRQEGASPLGLAAERLTWSLPARLCRR